MNSILKKIALLHLDVDLYDSYKVTLERLLPCVTKGGVVLFDEYIINKEKSPGSVKAIAEFSGDFKNEIQYNNEANGYYIIKR